jgi:hypothetical protein
VNSLIEDLADTQELMEHSARAMILLDGEIAEHGEELLRASYMIGDWIRGWRVIVKRYEREGNVLATDDLRPTLASICKSHAIWGHDGGNTSFPLVYLVKPKHMSDHAFRAVIGSIRLEMLGLIEVGK